MPIFPKKTMGNFLGNFIQNFPPKNHQKFLDEIFYLYFSNNPWYIIYKLAYLFLIIFSLCPKEMQQHIVMSAQMSKLPEAVLFKW